MLPFSIRPDSARANLVWATTLQLIEKLAGYAVLAVLTRTLLPEQMGSMFLAATISGIAGTAVTFGSGQHLVRAVATDRDRSLGGTGSRAIPQPSECRPCVRGRQCHCRASSSRV